MGGAQPGPCACSASATSVTLAVPQTGKPCLHVKAGTCPSLCLERLPCASWLLPPSLKSGSTVTPAQHSMEKPSPPSPAQPLNCPAWRVLVVTIHSDIVHRFPCARIPSPLACKFLWGKGLSICSLLRPPPSMMSGIRKVIHI